MRHALGSARRSHGAHKYDWSIGVAPRRSLTLRAIHVGLRCVVSSAPFTTILLDFNRSLNPFDYHRFTGTPRMLYERHAPFFYGPQARAKFALRPNRARGMGFCVGACAKSAEAKCRSEITMFLLDWSYQVTRANWAVRFLFFPFSKSRADGDAQCASSHRAIFLVGSNLAHRNFTPLRSLAAVIATLKITNARAGLIEHSRGWRYRRIYYVVVTAAKTARQVYGHQLVLTC